ncbi:MarR family winged helix-turn-helix transcriptional regulator [Amycolatopsis sp. NPDC088138]|uniref:MarR family winged helix-turn-helix transcriptional regulator n=1 Tax=Amycolatopsis sp. NPDC088138 TaxID=3363938 RepID=UPI00382B3EAA
MDPVEDSSAQSGPRYAAGALLGWGLARTKRTFYDWVEESLHDLPGGLRGYLVLAALTAGRPPSQLALANQLDLDRTLMTYLLDELETAGLVQRRPDPADRRARQVLITEAGSKALAECSSRVEEAERRLLAPLSAAEATAFRAMITRVAGGSQEGSDTSEPCPPVQLGSDCPETPKSRRRPAARQK